MVAEVQSNAAGTVCVVLTRFGSSLENFAGHEDAAFAETIIEDAEAAQGFLHAHVEAEEALLEVMVEGAEDEGAQPRRPGRLWGPGQAPGCRSRQSSAGVRPVST